MIGRREFVQGAGLFALQVMAPGGAHAAGPEVALQGDQPPSPDALASNHNYYLYGNGQAIRNLVVTVEVTEELFAPDGVGMQLNGYGPQGAGAAWQQYVVGVNHEQSQPLALGWSIENWPSTALREKLERTVHLKGDDLFNVHAQDVGQHPTFPAPGRHVPAGYRIRWELLSDANDPDGLITGAIYSITDNHGRTWSSGSHKILDFKYSNTNARVTREALASLFAFQFNIVGTNGGRYMFIESGSGTITYEASTAMTPQFHQPKNVSYQGHFTAELSNFRYGGLDGTPSKKFVQSFRAARTPKFHPGGTLALAPHIGPDAIGLLAVSVEGKLGAYSLAANGQARELASLGARNMAIPGSAIAAFDQAGPKDRAGIVAVDQSGQIVEFAIDRNGSISGPAEAGPKAITQRGAPIATSRQFGAAQTVLIVADDKGQLKVLWRKDGGSWSGPANIGPEEFTAKYAHVAAGRLGKGDRTGVFAVDKQGTLTVFRAEKDGAWTGPQAISGKNFAPPGAPISIFEGEERTFLFLVDWHGQPHMAVAESDGTFGALKPVGPKDSAVSGAPLAVVRRTRGPQFLGFLVDTKGTLTPIATDREGRASQPKPLGPVAQTAGRKFVVASRPSGDRDAINVYAIADGGPHDGEVIRFHTDDGEAWRGPELATS